MITNVYFVRHAEIVYTEDEYNRQLSEKGKQDINRITEALKDINLTRAVSSPYLRAIHTIEGVANSRELKIEIVEDFRERKIAEGYIEDFNGFTKNQWEDFDYCLEGGEALNQVRERGIKALKKVIKKYEGENIIIGTHGTILSVILNYFDPKYGFEFWKSMKMPHIIQTIFEDEKLKGLENIKY